MVAATEQGCAFCRPGVEREALWESVHYRILADEYPRCAGHVLLVTRPHMASQMSAPREWMPEFHEAQERIRRFLIETFGAAAFYENGAARQEVPHAHLHGLPFTPEVPEGWVAAGYVERIPDWEAARQEFERAGYYFYLEAGGERYLVRRYKFVLKRVRGQLVGQTEARLDAETGEMVRGGADVVARTIQLWQRWSKIP